jgi:phosphoribosylamine--glycine ligase
MGIADEFRDQGMNIFGPRSGAARIESSKVFAKELMLRHGIPCACSRSFSSYNEAAAYVQQGPAPIVIKADGLAAGKGVVVAQTTEQAMEALSAMMQQRAFGLAGDSVVVEECLNGREMSFFAFTDGVAVLPMVPACDYKRIFEGNSGPNTGGMGSYSPPEFYSASLGEEVMRTIIEPTIGAMRDELNIYEGILYGGLMITAEGPKVIEFNARLGDPETQVVLPRLESDLVGVLTAVINRRLAGIELKWNPMPCVCVVLASGGYPAAYRTGFPITGLADVDSDVMVFHAGTKTGPAGRVLTSGGRVLAVAALGDTVASAREKVYNNISRISFEGMYFRKDIALF